MTLGPTGQALYDQIAGDFQLDAISAAALLACCQLLDAATDASAGADPATADGRRRLAQARQALTAHVTTLRTLKALGLRPKKRSRSVATAAPVGGPDPRDSLA